VRTVVGVAIPLITFLLLTAVGLDLTVGDLVAVRRQPRIVAIGLLAPLMVLPFVALASIALVGPPAAIATSLLLVAACPIGGISNTYSYLARASTALSVTLTGASCLLATVTIPLLTRVFEIALGRPLGFGVPPGVLLLQLVVMLGAPIAVGMGIRRRWPQLADQRRGAVQRAGFVALSLLIAFVLWSEADAFVAGLSQTIPLAAAFVTLSFALGWMAGLATRASRGDRFTLAAEFATRNVAIATAIAVTLLRRVEFAVFAATYFVTELPLMLVAIAAYRVTGARRA
jgi:bile acid:Na+ symporter, BASS family